MKRKKTLIALLTAGVIAASLTACGGSSGTAAKSSSASSAASTAAEATPAAPSGESVDTGVFTTFLPASWCAYPQSDYSGEADKDGNYPVDPESYAMIKDGESTFDVFSKPTVYIYYMDSASAEDEAELTKYFYDETTDITVTINGVECPGFEAKSESFLADGETDVYDFVYIPIDDNSCIQFNIPVSVWMDSETEVGVSLEDADVQAILNGTSLD